jgi:hypothetical protein
MTRAERLETYQKLIEDAAACSAQMIAIMIKDNPPEDRGALWHHAHATMEQAIRDRLSREESR